MEQDKALDKIKKCLRLAASSNPHEAAAAMRQARALMEKHGLGQADVDMADIEEHGARAGAKVNPTQWECNLAGTVAHAYACRLIFMAGLGSWSFIGEMAEVASYTMTVLLRQIRQARRDYIGKALKRCKPATKTKRADVFCDAWVWSVRKLVMEFAGAELSPAVDAYVAKHHPELSTSKPTQRNPDTGRPITERALRDSAMGLLAADGVQLNHGMTGAVPLALH